MTFNKQCEVQHVNQYMKSMNAPNIYKKKYQKVVTKQQSDRLPIGAASTGVSHHTNDFVSPKKEIGQRLDRTR